MKFKYVNILSINYLAILYISIAISSLITASASIMTAMHTYASTLSKEDPPMLIEGAAVQNRSTDELDIDITIDPTEPLPPNVTQQLSTEGATDIDINSFPPSGVTILIDNETAYVTNRPVTIE
jgi:hypothetical protein